MQLMTTSSTAASASSVDRALIGEATRVLKRLSAQFPNLAIADLRVSAEEWAMGLADLSPAEIDRGLTGSRDRRFAPGIGEFRCLCRPALDPEYAWHEAQAGLQARARGELGVWSHPAVFRAACELSWDLRRLTMREVRVAWQRQLDIEFSKGWGDDVPPVPVKVEHRPTLKPMPAAVRKRLDDMFYRGNP